MPKASAAKIVSARKSARLLGVTVLFSLLVVGGGLWWRRHFVVHAAPQFTVNNHSFKLLVANTEPLQEKGLGDRTSLPADTGMVFPYVRQAERCFWMKDMRFPIDMIWVNDTKAVVTVEANVAPSTYPRAYCHTGRMVIELNAGAAERSGIKPGVQLTL